MDIAYYIINLQVNGIYVQDIVHTVYSEVRYLILIVYIRSDVKSNLVIALIKLILKQVNLPGHPY